MTDIKARVAAALSDLNQEQSSTAATAAEGPEEEEGVSPQQLGVASAAAALQDPRALRAVSLRTGLRESHVADALSLLSTRRVALGGEAGGEEGDKGDAELSLAALWRVEPAGGQQGAGAARGQALAVPGVQDLSAVDERRKEALKVRRGAVGAWWRTSTAALACVANGVCERVQPATLPCRCRRCCRGC